MSITKIKNKSVSQDLFYCSLYVEHFPDFSSDASQFVSVLYNLCELYFLYNWRIFFFCFPEPKWCVVTFDEIVCEAAD